MPYHIEAESIDLDELRKRIETTDLVPSRVALLEDIGTKFKSLEKRGITTLATLRYELKNSKRLDALATRTGIAKQYLILLRREIEGYFPKPAALKEFQELPQGEIEKLKQHGLHNAAHVYEATREAKDVAELAESTGVNISTLETLTRWVDLTRIRWVSPLTARMLADAGYDSTAKVAAADPETLCENLDQLNEGGRYFKGKIGLRDIKRLVHAAGYVSP
jgi:predicted flap endonuclease-1-like 5' DNA nuclease